MFKRPLLFACSLAALSGLGLVGPASADILDYNAGTAPGLTDSFPQFNPQLGTLDTVTLFGSIPWSETFTWTNNSGSVGFWNLQLDATFRVNVSNGDSFFTVGETVGQFGIAGPDPTTVTQQPSPFDFTCFCYHPLQLFQQEDSSSSFFQSYIGAGSLTLSGTEGSENAFAFWSPNLGPPNIVQNQNPYSVTVEYTYAPAVAPEPSFAFVISAVFGLLVALRFGRSAIRKSETDLT